MASDLFASGICVATGLVLGGGGSLIVPWAWRSMRMGVASRSWPTAPGEVQKSGIEELPGEDAVTYIPIIDYRYVVNGKGYVGRRVLFGGLAIPTRGNAQEVVDRYPVGQQVTVMYDPANPAESTLEPGASAGSVSFLATGIFCLVTGAGFVVMGMWLLIKK